MGLHYDNSKFSNVFKYFIKHTPGKQHHNIHTHLLVRGLNVDKSNWQLSENLILSIAIIGIIKIKQLMMDVPYLKLKSSEAACIF